MMSRSHPLAWLLPECRGRQDAEDLLNEAFVKVEKYRQKVGAEEYRRQVPLNNEGEYLRRTVRNLVTDRIRFERKRSYVSKSIDEVIEDQSLIFPTPTPDDHLAKQDELDEIERRLATVSKKTREIYLWHVLGYTYAEIALQIGLDVRTVKWHMAKALRALDGE